MNGGVENSKCEGLCYRKMKNTFRVKCSEKGRSFSSLIQINSNVFPSPFSVRDFFICSLDSRPRIQREAFSSVSIQLARSFLASSRERGKYYRPEKCEISSSLARSRGTKQARAERSLPLRVAHSHLRPNKQTQAQREDIFSSRSARSLVPAGRAAPAIARASLLPAPEALERRPPSRPPASRPRPLRSPERMVPPYAHRSP